MRCLFCFLFRFFFKAESKTTSKPDHTLFILRAASWLEKADGRRPDTSAGRSCRRKRFLYYEMQFKHILPHDVGSNSKKYDLRIFLRLIKIIMTLMAADSVRYFQIMDRCSLNWRWYRRLEPSILLLCLRGEKLYAGIMTEDMNILVFLYFTTHTHKARQTCGHQPYLFINSLIQICSQRMSWEAAPFETNTNMR